MPKFYSLAKIVKSVIHLDVIRLLWKPSIERRLSDLISNSNLAIDNDEREQTATIVLTVRSIYYLFVNAIRNEV